MKWWRRRDTNGHENAAAARARAESEARFRAVADQTPMVERYADDLRYVPLDELTDRVARAFRRRPA